MNGSNINLSQLLSHNDVIVASKEQVSSDLAGESVILNLKNGTYYGLNEVGSTIWNLIQEPKSVGDVYQSILQDYDVDAQTCATEVQALLSDLLNAQLIEIRNAEAS